MEHITQLIQHYGVPVVFLTVLLSRAGVPFPAWPILLVAGALTAANAALLPILIGTAMAGDMIADVCWYAAGARWGRRVLGLLCKFTLNHGLRCGCSIVFVGQMSLDVLTLVGNCSFHMRYLFLEFPKFGIPVAKFCIQLSILGSEIRLLCPKYLQGRAWGQRTNELGVTRARQPEPPLLHNSVRFGLRELFIELLQAVGHNVVALVCAQQIVLFLLLLGEIGLGLAEPGQQRRALRLGHVQLLR